MNTSTGHDTGSAQDTPPVFYTLPAELLDVGMSTDDGQDILAVDTDHDELVIFDVYTPADDPDEDNDRQCSPEGRTAHHGELVQLAVFSNTTLDASGYPQAVITPAGT